VIPIGRIKMGRGHPFILIAGPCVIESEDLTLKVAVKLEKICSSLQIPFIFKSSFDKANRTSIHSFRGPGLKKGLKVLAKVKEKVGVPVLTDIHLPEQAEPAAEVVDVLQIPAFLCRQTDLLVSAGKTGKPVNIKKGQFLSPEEILPAIEKVLSTGNTQVMVTERGTFFGYHNLVVDFRNLKILRGYGVPVVYDATHSLQLPGGEKTRSGGQREFVEPLARAAVAIGVDALFIETHPEPEKALSDPATQMPLDALPHLLQTLKALEQAKNRLRH